MKKNMFLSLLLLPILAGCAPKGENLNSPDEEKGKTVSLTQIMKECSLEGELPSKIWYYQFGAATNTIFAIDSEQYSEVLKKFSDLKLTESDTIQKKVTKDFYLSLFYDSESLDENDEKYILGMSENVAYVAFQNDEEVKYYTAEISEETYQNARNYFNALEKSREIS